LLGDAPPAIWVVLGTYILSAQVLAMGMTTYAMSAHLAFNSVWFALFIKNRSWSHALAMLVGVAAMGLHQFVFHPLFAGPLILLLAMQRRWLAFSAYAIVYSVGLVFWMTWSGMVLNVAGIEPGVNGSGGLVDFVSDRVLPLLTSAPFPPHVLMSANFLRALTWNALFALPLVVAAWIMMQRGAKSGNRARDPIVVALFASIIITLLFMYVVLPLQGHGWGYRYLHGHLGSIALLAGYGYRDLAATDRLRVDGAIIALGLVTILIVIPAGLWSANRFTAPHVEVATVIAAQDTDFVVIDDGKWTNIVDETRNWPDLSNRPLVFSRRAMTPAQLRDLCRRGSVSVIAGDVVKAARVPGKPEANVTPLGNPCVD
jgi:hypothetical protein